jgi:hypothetical protein
LGRPSAEGDLWLSRSAGAGNLKALHILAGRHEEVGRGHEAQQWRRRIIEAGNSADIHTLADQLDRSDRTQAEYIRRYGIEPGGATAAPW